MNRILKLNLVLFTYSYIWKIFFEEWFIVAVTSSKSVHMKRIHTNSSKMKYSLTIHTSFYELTL